MPHYFSEKQQGKADFSKITIRLKDHAFELWTANGIFSNKKLDLGSKLLIEKSVIPPNARVLDLGCGIGVVGVAIKLLHPDSDVTMSDINERAVAVAKKNVELHELNIKVVNSNGFEQIGVKFDVILLNPPQTAGKAVCQMLIRGAKDHLNKGGIFQLVARHKKGGKSLEAYIKEIFGNVNVIAKQSGYRIYGALLHSPNSQNK